MRLRVVTIITAATILSLELRQASAQPLDIEFQGRVNTLGNVADALPALLNYFNDVGFRKNVGSTFKSAGSEVNELLQWTPGRGVLVGVTVQVPTVQPANFVLREVLGGAVIYGVSATPQGALASYFERVSSGRGVLRPATKTDWVISQEWSKHFWVTRSPQGGYNIRRYEYGYLNRMGAELYTNQELRRSMARVEQSDLMMTMADEAIKKSKIGAAKQKILLLRQNAAAALERLNKVNEQLNAELQRGAQLSSIATTLGAIGSFISLVGQIDAVSAQLGSATPVDVLNAKSKAELDAALQAAQQRNLEASRVLQDTKTNEEGNYLVHKQTLIIELKSRGVPTDSIP